MKRWYQSRTIWTNAIAFMGNVWLLLATLAATAAPEILLVLPTFGLEPRELVLYSLAVNLAVNMANLYLRGHSPSAIGNAGDVDSYRNASERGYEDEEPL